ncbi:phosphopantothenoylcysteine decarboxylase [Lentisphaerota bacterium WC36G]|nr:hypothetical protein LJT99_10350 [Lentisphaerae bacterium WC36]
MKKKILISAGPTREHIDAVRFITNRSTGKMGYAIAEAAVAAGYDVSLVSGVVNLTPPANLTDFMIAETAADMADTIKRLAINADIVIMNAAVADYRPKQTLINKMKKKDSDLVLELERTEDILKSLGEMKKFTNPDQILVGFAAETDNVINYATEKLENKNLDWIVANDVSNNAIGFGSDNNAVVLINRKLEKIKIPQASKLEIAQLILNTIIP